MAENEEFFDEKIVEFRRRARKEKYSTLETGMYINDELVEFKRQKLFHDKLSIMLPMTFVDLPTNLAKIKYTSEQRPQIIKTSLDTTVNLGINMLNVDIQDEQIEPLLEQAKTALKRMNPAMTFYDSKIEKAPMMLGWFEFKSFGLDSNVYNLMFVTRVDGKMVQGVFNCIYEDALEWRDAAHQMVNSIRDITERGKDNEGTENHSGAV